MKKNMKLFLLFIILIIFIIVMVNKKEKSYIENTIIVSNYNNMGTLWDIAEEYCPNYISKQDYIHYIMKDNNCTELIHNGDVLKIRIYE